MLPKTWNQIRPPNDNKTTNKCSNDTIFYKTIERQIKTRFESLMKTRKRIRKTDSVQICKKSRLNHEMYDLFNDEQSMHLILQYNSHEEIGEWFKTCKKWMNFIQDQLFPYCKQNLDWNLNEDFIFFCAHGMIDGIKHCFSKDKKNVLNVTRGYYFACKYGHVKIIEYLDSFYYSKLCSILKTSCFRNASENGHLPVIKYLLKSIKKKREKEECKGASFYSACRSGKLNIVQFWTSKKNLHSLNWGYILEIIIIREHLEVLKHILSLKNEKYFEESLILEKACIFNKLNIVKFAFNNLNVSKTLKQELLIICCRSGHLEIIEFLVSQGVDIHVKNEMGLKLACICNQLSVVKYLISLGANLSVDNQQILYEACINCNLPLIQYLVSQGAKIAELKHEQLHKIVTNPHFREVVKYFISQGFNIRPYIDDILEKIIKPPCDLEWVKFLVRQE